MNLQYRLKKIYSGSRAAFSNSRNLENCSILKTFLILSFVTISSLQLPQISKRTKKQGIRNPEVKI